LGQVLESSIGGGWGEEVSSDSHPEPAYVIRGTDIPSAKRGRTSNLPHRFHKTSNLRSRRLAQGDIVLEVSGGSKGQPVSRSLLITQQIISDLDEAVMCASFRKQLRVDRSQMVPEALFLTLQDAYEDGRIESFQVQSTGISNLRFAPMLDQFSVVLPPQQLQAAFQYQIQAMYRLIGVLGAQSEQATYLRDVLIQSFFTRISNCV
jgi:type I restriction enzyme S subunit